MENKHMFFFAFVGMRGGRKVGHVKKEWRDAALGQLCAEVP
jgi:hypothetical protein